MAAIDEKELDDFLGSDSPGPSAPHPFDLASAITRTSQKYGIPESILHAQVMQESGGNPKAKSSAGAQGLMQIMPETGKELGLKNPWDPEESLDKGAGYLKSLSDQFGGTHNGLLAYNAGPGNFKKYKGNIPFKETQGYAKTIEANASKYKPKAPAIDESELDDFLKESPASEQKSVAPQDQDFIPHPMTDGEAVNQENARVAQGGESSGSDAIKTLKGLLSGASVPGSGIASGIMNIPRAMYNKVQAGENPSISDIPGIIGEGRQHYNQAIVKGQKEAPLAAMAGSLPRNVAEWELGGGALKSIPGLSALFGAGEGTGALAKLGNIVKAGARGATLANTMNLAEGGEQHPLLNTIAGGGGEALGTAAEAVSPYANKTLANVLDKLPENLRNTFESYVPFLGKGAKKFRMTNEAAGLKQFEEAQNIAEGLHGGEKQAASEAIEDLPSVGKREAGTNLATKGEQGYKNLQNEYGDVFDPIQEKHINSRVDTVVPNPSNPEKEVPIRDYLGKQLRKVGLIDDGGKVLWDDIEKTKSSNLRDEYKWLADHYENMPRTETVGKLNRMKRDLEEMAGINQQTGRASKGREIYQKLSGDIDKMVNSGLEKVATPEERQALQAINQKYGEKVDLYKGLRKLEGKPDETVTQGVSNMLKGSEIDKKLVTHPELRQELQDVVMNNIAKRGTTARSLTKVIKEYERPTLLRLLGEEKFNALEAAEKRLAESSKPFVRGSYEAPKPNELYQAGAKVIRKSGKLLKGGANVANVTRPIAQTILNRRD